MCSRPQYPSWQPQREGGRGIIPKWMANKQDQRLGREARSMQAKISLGYIDYLVRYDFEARHPFYSFVGIICAHACHPPLCLKWGKLQPY
jgi:hypothetical protein